ncbi:hypothetical protein [Roseobacter sp. HKCCA0434]|uniref:hypothetical protein n=1 Tax=Roseobacter sp. HKCCA0434 TaxID=3079297 RepID=UPI0029058BA0|nr:hypothetical protein [Roseobacter sp. HKCCA0434]
MIRHHLKLPGHSGKIPALKFPLSKDEHGEALSVTIEADGTICRNVSERVRKIELEDGTQIDEIRGTRDQVEQVLRTRIRRGTIKLPSNFDLDEMDELIAGLVSQSSVHTSRAVESTFTVNLADHFRAFIKIAFNFAHIMFGPDWTFSERADPLRRAVLDEMNFKQLSPFVMKPRPDLRKALIGRDMHLETAHILGVLPTPQGASVLISLLGVDMLLVAIQISPPPDFVVTALINERPALIAVTPDATELSGMGFEELMSRLSAFTKD